MIFSGGMAYEKSGQTPTLTVIRGTSTTVLEMEHPVIDFVTVCSTPWNSGRSCALHCPLLYCPALYTVMHSSYNFVSSICWIFLKIQSTTDPATAPSSVHISGNPVDVVESFIYLGSEIHSILVAQNQKCVIRSISLAKSCFNLLNRGILRSSISLPTKVQLYHTCIQPGSLIVWL